MKICTRYVKLVDFYCYPLYFRINGGKLTNFFKCRLAKLHFDISDCFKSI